MEELAPALFLISKFEGCRLTAYRDAVGIPTIGWGSTEGVVDGMQISQAEADERLHAECQALARRIKAAVKIELSKNALCALISFAYNVGFQRLLHSTLLAKINAGDTPESCAGEFAKWVFAGGKILPGLVTRRAAESNLFVAPDDQRPI